MEKKGEFSPFSPFSPLPTDPDRMSDSIDERIVEDCARNAAKAFLASPAYYDLYRLPKDSPTAPIQLENILFSLFQKNIQLITSKYPTALHYYYEENGTEERKFKCSFMLVPSDSSYTFLEMMYFGLWKFFWEAGVPAALRLLKAVDYYEAKWKGFLQGRKGIILERMFVNPEMQGKGVGSHYLGEALKAVADENQLPVVLSTQLPQNVTFYKRL